MDGIGDDLPFGLVNFKVLVDTPGEEVTVTVYFSEAVPPKGKWYKYDPIRKRWYRLLAIRDLQQRPKVHDPRDRRRRGRGCGRRGERDHRRPGRRRGGVLQAAAAGASSAEWWTASAAWWGRSGTRPAGEGASSGRPDPHRPSP